MLEQLLIWLWPLTFPCGSSHRTSSQLWCKLVGRSEGPPQLVTDSQRGEKTRDSMSQLILIHHWWWWWWWRMFIHQSSPRSGVVFSASWSLPPVLWTSVETEAYWLSWCQSEPWSLPRSARWAGSPPESNARDVETHLRSRNTWLKLFPLKYYSLCGIR